MFKKKRLIIPVLYCFGLFFATLAATYILSRTGAISNLFPTSEPLVSFQQFYVIAHDLDESGDLNAECELQLGGGVRLADWNDIVAYYEGGGSLDEFIAGIKMPIRDDMRPFFEQIVQTNKEKAASKSNITSTPETYDDEYRISLDGNLRYANTGRHYFVGRHDHIKPPGFLDHDNLNNNQLSLGSWRGRGGYAICYGEFNENTTGVPLASFQKFHLIAHNLDEYGDLNGLCQTELGENFRIADWNDIVAFYHDGGSLDDFIAGLRMAEREEIALPEMGLPIRIDTSNITEMPKEVPDAIADEYRISKDGELRWQIDRHYFVGRHEHIKPPGFLDHDHINNYQLTLGSWRGKGGYALAYGNLIDMSIYTVLLVFYGIVLCVTLTIIHILNPGWLFKGKTQE
ncbi:hypothetical protein F4X73_05630 [Candidatus Poribacteria bacterium]|nr:hypothetical protein [Candidatus Poribacteria bacterium]